MRPRIPKYVTTAWLTHLTPYISAQFHHLVLFWHQSAAHHWCSYVHLSVTQRYKRKLIWVSQSAAECFIRHTVVCVHSGLSPVFSLAPALRTPRRTLCLFSLYSHYWSYFWWVTPQWLKCILYFGRLQSCFTVSTGCRPHSACVCMQGFQEPYANT